MRPLTKNLLTTLAVTLLALTASAAGAQEFGCIPSCEVNDARFLALTPPGALQSLSPATINVEIASDGGDVDFILGVFDGDTGALDVGGDGHWDLSPTGGLVFTLYADPLKDGTGSFVVPPTSISPDLTTAVFADNAWTDFTVTNVPEALSPSGDYFYRLEVALVGATGSTTSAFKLRTSGFSSIQVFQQPFAFIGMIAGTFIDDFRIVYPFLTDLEIFDLIFNVTPAPTGAGTTYDGSLSFFINFDQAQTELKLYDGDMDRGDDIVPGALDTDDPNTPNNPTAEPFAGGAGFSAWATAAAEVEGIAYENPPPPPLPGTPPPHVRNGVGNPMEDRSENAFRRDGAVTYTVIAPDGREFTNTNPSGNVEWERFSVLVQPDSVPCDPAVADICTPEILPAGTYEVRLEGLDMQNLNFFYFFDPAVCVVNGSPCKEPGAFLVGDTVFFDDDGNGTQDGGDLGIPGVVMELVDPSGTVVDRTATDASGNYSFPVNAGTHTVRVASGNFDGPPTGGAVGDYVWLDANGDGLQAGDEGIPNVEVLLFDAGLDGMAGGGDDVFLGSVATDSDGRYRFGNLAPGSYYTSVKADTVPDGLVLSGGTSPSAIAVITTNEEDLTLDFGYTNGGATAAIGDRIWHDINGDGVQDAGEPGISNVTVQLVNSTTSEVVGVTTTVGGYYLFTGVPAGMYDVVVTDTNGVLSAYAQTGDPDEAGSCSTCDGVGSRTLAAGDVDLSVDFGYQQAGLFSIDDVVWFDSDRNGLLDGAETGLGGVTMALVDVAGKVLATTTTAADGSFSFSGLADGDYTLQITDLNGVLDGLLATTPGSARETHEDEIDGADVSGVNFGWVDTGALEGLGATTPSPEQTNTVTDDNILTYDFGYTLGSIGDRVWLDDGDGAQEVGEPGLNGVTVRLFDAGGTEIASQMTTGDGNYLFDDLPGGFYTVVVDAGTLPAGLSPTFDLDGVGTPNAAGVNLPPAFDEPDADFGYVPVCGLSISKTCAVIAPPQDFNCSDAKPLDTLEMVWNGTGTVNVKAWKGPVGSELLATVNGVGTGDVVSVSGYAGSPNDVFWEVFDGTTKLGESKYHLSCSDSEMNGAEDCLKAQGDGKSDDSGFLNLWLLEGLAGSGLVLDCTPPSGPGDELCEAVANPVPSCETTGDPNNLTWEYTGGGCAETDNDQEPGKHICTESSPGIDGNASATMTADDGTTLTLTPGEEFILSRSASKEIELTQGVRQELNVIHTSCSQPLQAGDVYGSLTLRALDGLREGTPILYTYELTNNGAALTDLSVVDNVLGDVGGPISLDNGETAVFELLADLTETTTNRADADGLLALGLECSANDEATVILTEPCDVCDGGTTDLVFQYLGASTATVTIYDKDSVDPSKILFSGPVDPGELVPITKRPGQSKFASNISLWVNGVENAELHTSCSQPIGPGQIAGDFLIVEARSRNNGLMCDLDVCNAQASSGFDFSGQELRWDVTNDGDLPIVIESITIEWASANGDLVEIKREGDTIHQGDFAPNSATITGGWEGNRDKRQIDPGDTNTIKFKFDNDASLTGAYDVTIEFDQGCMVSASFTPPISGGDLVCSKPIDQLTMIWNGGETVRVKAWKGSVGSQLLADVAAVPVLGEISVSGFAGSPNDVFWEIFSTAGGNKLGESKFHLSCSDDDMDGPEDCGKAAGNGKDGSGFLNDWTFEGMVDSDETLDCTAGGGPSSGSATSRVSSSLDDVEERVSDGDIYTGSSDLELIDDSDYRGPQIVGMRFRNLAVPQGATITSAYIEFETDETDSVSTALVFRAQAADDAPAFVDSPFNVSSRSLTAASTAWGPAPWSTTSEKHQTPDLSAVVQEVVDRAGWSSGGAMVFVVSGSGERTAEAYDGESANAPLLVVNFTSP